MAPPGCGGISPDAVAAEREGSRTAERNRVIGRNGAGSVKGVRIGHVRRIVGKSQVSCVLEGDVFRKDDGPFGSVVVNVDVMASREGNALKGVVVSPASYPAVDGGSQCAQILVRGQRKDGIRVRDHAPGPGLGSQFQLRAGHDVERALVVLRIQEMPPSCQLTRLA